jgi:hypothetical protein
MARKLVVWTTLLAFFFFDVACVIRRTRGEPPEKVYSGNPQVLAVLKKSGEYIEFSKENPGRVMGDKIVASERILEIPNSAIKRIIAKDGKPSEIEKVDGTRVPLTAVLRKDESKTVVLLDSSGFAIPLADVDMVTVRRVDTGTTILATVGLTALVFTGIVVVIFLIASCPFVYSWDGSRFVFDAEPFGGAICEGLKRTELCALDYLTETNGTYRLLLTNEVNETQHTDLLKLVVVDHPQGTTAVPEFAGGIHAISAPVSPSRACDKGGRDLMPLVGEKDWKFWQSRESDFEKAGGKDRRDELVFEFPKPPAAKTARLIVNGCSTLWGSQMVKKFLELYGQAVGEWYQDVNRFGPSFFRTMAWDTREEIYRLHIRVETERGWTSKGMIMGGGPLVSEDRIYSFDITDVPGDVLRIKLTPPATFWMINWLAVDYGEDSPCQITELSPIKGVDGTGRDVPSLLALEDRGYLSMPNTGDRAEVTFLAPPRRDGAIRSVFLKASGFYDIHLEAVGEPQTELIRQILDEPGFFVRYSIDNYRKWKEENNGRERSR